MDTERKTAPSAAFDALAGALIDRLADRGSEPWSDDDFDAWAFRVFAHQFEHNEPYRAFCQRRGVAPETLGSWRDAPPVPTTAFKHLDLVSAPGRPEAVFQTSGTTRGPAQRGRHLVPSLALYRASLLPSFRTHLVPDGAPLRFVSFIPRASAAPTSSLSFMVTAAAEALASDVAWVVDADGALDETALEAVLADITRAGEPVLVLGTALAFLHVSERREAAIPALPEGSRVMETGGFKGLGRTVTREELHQGIGAVFGVDGSRIVNEYGMTELLSQLYEPVLLEGPGSAGEHVPAPQLRVRALDPVTLEERLPGQEGILAFFDLANAGSVSAVLTQDVGSVRDGRVRLRGRLPGAEPRGCSRAMDELMRAAAGSRR